jgi:hypothetical protein
MTVGPGHARTGSQIVRFGTTPGGYLGGQLGCLPLGDIARHILSRPLPSVTQTGIAASRLEPPWRASRHQPGEMTGIGPIDRNPEQIHQVVIKQWCTDPKPPWIGPTRRQLRKRLHAEGSGR